MNEKDFRTIVQGDLEKLNSLISKGYFDTSDFKEAVLNASNSLSILYQILDIRSKRSVL